MSDVVEPTVVVDAEPARPVAGPDGTRSDRARRSAYRARFALVYVLLAILAGGAVGAFAVLASRPEAAEPAKWSTWAPTGSEQAKARQIADRVSKRYRLASGQQLALALVGPAQVSAGGTDGGNIPVRAIAVRPDTSKGTAEESDIDIFDARSSLTFVLCGLGANCSIKTGKPSEARHALLRRESLELALYTFKYVKDVDAVTVFLPPHPDGTTAPTSVFLRKRDVKRELGRPLARTLAPSAPRLGKMSSRELAAVNRVTRPHLYQYEYQQAQDGSAVLVLAPVVA